MLEHAIKPETPEFRDDTFSSPASARLYIVRWMRNLAERGVDPSFSGFQSSGEWREIRQQLSLEAKRRLILLWDEMYADLAGAEADQRS